METCGKCGREVAIGDWPWCPHGPARDGGLFIYSFEPYFDEHVVEGKEYKVMDGEVVSGTYITSPGHRAQLMRENKTEFRGHKRGERGQMF